MKQILGILILLILQVIATNAQIRVITNQSERITGYKTDENDSIISLRGIAGGDYVIKKKNIKFIDVLTSEVVTKSGERYLGNISLMNNKGYEIKKQDGDLIHIPNDEVQKYKLCDRLYSSGYVAIGITLFGPGELNIVGSSQFENSYFFRVVYGASINNETYGYQLNIGYNLIREKNIEQNLSIGAGVTFDRFIHNTAGYKSTIMKDTKYLGFFYDVNFYGIFFEAGALFGEGVNNGIGASFQVGYIYRFL